MSVTRTFIEKINNIKYEDFSDSNIKTAKLAIMDNVGNALGALSTGVGSIFVSLAHESDNGCCSVWGTGKKTSLMEASLVNASLAQVLDCDDTYEINSLAVSHPGPAVVAAALTVAEQESSSGRDVIRAVILGYEAAVRVAKAIEPRRDEFWGFANTQIIGAVTATAILLGLNDEEMINAFGTAVSCSPVPNTNMMWSLTERPISWIKDGVGFAVSTGVMSACMAKKGFHSTQKALDKETGYYLLCGSEDYNEEEIIKGLGENFAINKMSFKPYPTCRFMQSSLDSLELLLRENAIRNEDVEKIEVYLTPSLKKFFSVYKPYSMIDAQFSLPYAAAMVLKRVPPSSLWYKEEYLNNDAILETAQKIRLIADAEIEKLRTEKSILSPKVKIYMKNGSVYEKQEYCAKGHPDKPLTEKEFQEKFFNMLPDIKTDRESRLVKSFMELEDYRSINGLIKNLEIK